MNADENCIFCKIIKKQAEARIEEETNNVIAFRSIDPVSDTHILVVPKKHISSFIEIKKADEDTYFEMLEMAQRFIIKNKLESGYKLIFNGGKYQVIPHVHWHLLAGNLKDKNDLLNKT